MTPPRNSLGNILGRRSLFRLWIGQMLSALGSYLGIPGPSPNDTMSRVRDKPAYPPSLAGSADRRKKTGPEAPATLDIGGVI